MGLAKSVFSITCITLYYVLLENVTRCIYYSSGYIKCNNFGSNFWWPKRCNFLTALMKFCDDFELNKTLQVVFFSCVDSRFNRAYATTVGCVFVPKAMVVENEPIHLWLKEKVRTCSACVEFISSFYPYKMAPPASYKIHVPILSLYFYNNISVRISCFLELGQCCCFVYQK